MRRQELKELISRGESGVVEFKRKFTSHEKMAKEITAFANTKGGWLIIGVDDDKKIVGVKSEKEEIAQVLHSCEFYSQPPIEPTIDIVEIEYKDVVVVRIKESDVKPHRVLYNPDNANGEYAVFIRQGEESVMASKEMARILRSQRADAPPLRLSIGDKERALFRFLEKAQRATVKDFAALVNISERRAARLMVRLVRAGSLNIHTDGSIDYYTATAYPE